MWLSLFLILLIAAVTYFIAIQGLFSALIMCVFTVLCCAFAFGIHEYVALEYLIQWKPDFAIPLSLVLSFAVPLIILRSAADAVWLVVEDNGRGFDFDGTVSVTDRAPTSPWRPDAG